MTTNGSDVFPTLCASDAAKQFSNDQSVRNGSLLLVPRDESDG